MRRGVRLLEAHVVEAYGATLAAAVERAMTRQRAAVRAALRAHGLGWESPVATTAAELWPPSAWAEAVDAEVLPVARALAVSALDAVKYRVPAKARWGMDDNGEALASLVTFRILKAGAAVGARLTMAATEPAALVAAGGNLRSISDALDGALVEFNRVVERTASHVANGASAELAATVNDNTDDAVEQIWVTYGDDRVRPDHEDAEGQTQPAGEPFDVGGELLMYPGDENGSPENTENCRCWLEVVGISDLSALKEYESTGSKGPGASESAISEAGQDIADALGE